MADLDTVRATITDLRARLDALPDTSGVGIDYARKWRACKDAEQALADHLRATYGARIADKAWTHTIRMHGISSSGTSGQSGAFRNWLRAAERTVAAS